MSYMIVEKKELSKEGMEELERITEGIIRDLGEINDIGKFLAYDVLDIEKVQSLGSEGWETEEYTLCLACGGPGAWVKTSGKMITAWAGDYLETRITDNKALEKLKEIEDYLNEIYD